MLNNAEVNSSVHPRSTMVKKSSKAVSISKTSSAADSVKNVVDKTDIDDLFATSKRKAKVSTDSKTPLEATTTQATKPTITSKTASMKDVKASCLPKNAVQKRPSDSDDDFADSRGSRSGKREFT